MLLAAWVLLGLVVLLAVPVDVAFRLERIEALDGQLMARWMFGLVKIRVTVPRIRSQPAEPAARPERAEKPAQQRKARRRTAAVLHTMRQPAFRRRAFRFVGDLMRAAHITRLRLRVRLGLGDPADTGLLWGIVGPLNAMAQGLRTADVRLEPEFVDPVLELQAQGRLLIFPLQILALAISFALSPSSIRAWRTLRSGHA